MNDLCRCRGGRALGDFDWKSTGSTVTAVAGWGLLLLGAYAAWKLSKWTNEAEYVRGILYHASFPKGEESKVPPFERGQALMNSINGVIDTAASTAKDVKDLSAELKKLKGWF